MSIFWRNLLLMLILAALAGCAGGQPTGWGHFHGNLSNQGVQQVESGFALSSHWISKPYRITSSSPVIGSDFQDREIVPLKFLNSSLLQTSVDFSVLQLGQPDFLNSCILKTPPSSYP